MPAWGELVESVGQLPDEKKGPWLISNLQSSLQEVSRIRGGRNVLFYASSWLQKPMLPSVLVQIMHEDINGFMTSIHGMDWSRGLTLILHTPGGAINAAETIVAYLQSKFPEIETIVPVYAMSAGTMITLGTDRVIMGRQSQLGPIDPQMPMGNSSVSARAIVEQFSRAQQDISGNPMLAHLWAPVLQTFGPALLTEALNALSFGERLVGSWLKQRMFSARADRDIHSELVAKFFNDASQHLSHGRRIDRDEVRGQDIPVTDLEDDQDLQEYVLTAYHVMTILFEMSPASKTIFSNSGRTWIKNAAM
ncbi:S49 family peptidase [Agrobacterium vitis]|uniref:SDH family Clp fold serine proteinase n=1 Tax=Agrobacterium vitis TaxID=373 RepID=UPI001574D6E0|nr:ATP-dependent Clp protease proteolytic subunit [Agrobacterium vitis]NSY10850.1 S49 family peptidase [Agrobacterium vitis]